VPDAPSRSRGGRTTLRTGGDHSCALGSGGTPVVLGDNALGQLGDGTDDRAPGRDTVQIGTDTDWAAVTAGREQQRVARKTTGSILVRWGRPGGQGALGDGTHDGDRHAPVRIGTQAWVAIPARAARTPAP